MYKEGRLPDEFNDFLASPDYSHWTRLEQNFVTSQPRTDMGKSSIKYQGVQVWNNLPLSIKNETNRLKFNDQLKTYLQQEQQV